jgi:transposase
MIQELPTDIHKLHEMIASLQDERKIREEYLELIQSNLNRKEVEILTKTNVISEKDNLIRSLQAQLDLLRNQIFNRTSEKMSPKDERNAWLFNEVEAYKNEREKSPLLTEVKAHKKRKGGRREIPAHFPRKEIIIELKPEDLNCGCGCQMEKIGEEVSEKLHLVPASVLVLKMIRCKYGCINKDCPGKEAHGTPAVKLAPMPLELLPKIMVSLPTVAYFIVQKFCDHIPYYRLAKILLRHNVEITRATLCNYTSMVYEVLKPVLLAILNKLFSCPVVQVDETPCLVMNEAGRKNTDKSYMMVMLGLEGDEKYVYFQYEPSRSASFLLPLIQNFKGVIQTDAFPSYDAHLREKKDIVHAGCNTHARREFKNIEKLGSEDETVRFVLRQYSEIYKLEDEFKESKLDFTNIQKERETKSLPLLLSIKQRLEEIIPTIPPKSPLGSATRYFLGQWHKLTRFIYDGRIPPDTNWVENQIRPFALGRKNWLLSGSPHGAEASAGMYTILQNAILAKLDPLDYLTRVLQILESNPDTSPNSLIPQNIGRGS